MIQYSSIYHLTVKAIKSAFLSNIFSCNSYQPRVLFFFFQVLFNILNFLFNPCGAVHDVNILCTLWELSGICGVSVFDTVDYNILLSRHKHAVGFKGRVLSQFKSYLSERSFSVATGEYSSSSVPISCTTGVCCGPLCYLYTCCLWERFSGNIIFPLTVMLLISKFTSWWNGMPLSHCSLCLSVYMTVKP